MGCLGVHIALTADEAVTLRSFPDERGRLEHLQEIIEEHYFHHEPDFKAESDKSWDAMRRTLTDGELKWNSGLYPLSHVVLGGESLYTSSEYIMILKTAQQVRDVAAALPAITEDVFRLRYFAIDSIGYEFPLSEDDFNYTWDWFQGVRDLYLRAADGGRLMLFAADQ